MSIEHSLLVASAIRLYKIVSCLATSGTFVSCLKSSNIGTTSRKVVWFGIGGVEFNGLMNMSANSYADLLKFSRQPHSAYQTTLQIEVFTVLTNT